MTAVLAVAPPRGWTWRFRVGPPGSLLYVATLSVIGVALEFSSRSSDLWGAALLWLLVGSVWLVRFGIAVSRDPATTLRAGGRWLGVPLAFAVAIALMWSRVAFDARRELSRPALDTIAADFSGGRATQRDWVGLYPVIDYQITGNGFRFAVAEGIFDRHGYAYSTTGQPILTDANFSPVWTGARFQSIGGGWWYWTETWD
jgi:hypothetical protein